MPAKKRAAQDYVHHHQDGSLWAKGQLREGKPTGYWEWFRKDGTKLRSGYFERGAQTGAWTTYDRKGAVYKVTDLTAKSAPKKRSRSATKASKKA
ncbi:MAG: hypothetical protein JNK23_09215 [Opitutaceae bacterium]|nr:hypothetical protein [Opitutaceae bacterium]